jgi:hypothetical protein
MACPSQPPSTIGSAIELTKKVRQLADTMKNVKLKSTIADLSNSLADAKLQAADLKGEIAARDEEIARLKDALKKAMEVDVVLRDGFYYKRLDGDGPFSSAANGSCTVQFMALGRWTADENLFPQHVEKASTSPDACLNMTATSELIAAARFCFQAAYSQPAKGSDPVAGCCR